MDMRSLLCLTAFIVAGFAVDVASAQDRGVNLGDKLPSVGNGNVKVPAGLLPWYNRMRQNKNRGPVNPIAGLQAQQQQAQAVMIRQQAAYAAKKAAEKQRKKEQQNAVRAKQRAEELAERGASAKP
jgi:hypothetical protein